MVLIEIRYRGGHYFVPESVCPSVSSEGFFPGAKRSGRLLAFPSFQTACQFCADQAADREVDAIVQLDLDAIEQWATIREATDIDLVQLDDFHCLMGDLLTDISDAPQAKKRMTGMTNSDISNPLWKLIIEAKTAYYVQLSHDNAAEDAWKNLIQKTPPANWNAPSGPLLRAANSMRTKRYIMKLVGLFGRVIDLRPDYQVDNESHA